MTARIYNRIVTRRPPRPKSGSLPRSVAPQDLAHTGIIGKRFTHKRVPGLYKWTGSTHVIGAKSTKVPLRSMNYEQFSRVDFRLGKSVATTYHIGLAGPVRVFKKIIETWHLERSQAAILLGRQRDYVDRLLRGNAAPDGRDIADRIVCLFYIRKTLFELFRDEKTENEWLREPRDLLKGKKPIELLLEGSMENMLTVREFVDAAAGR